MVDVPACRLQALVVGDGQHPVGHRQRRREHAALPGAEQRIDDGAAARRAGKRYEEHRVGELEQRGEHAGSTVDHDRDHRPPGRTCRPDHVQLRLGKADRRQVHALAVGGVRSGTVGRAVVRELVLIGAAAGPAEHHHAHLRALRRLGHRGECLRSESGAQSTAPRVRHGLLAQAPGQRRTDRERAGVLGRARRGVVAQQRVEIVGVRADGGDPRGPQRQVLLAAEDDHRLSGRALGERDRGAGSCRGPGCLCGGPVEHRAVGPAPAVSVTQQPDPPLQCEHAGGGAPQRGLLDEALVDRRLETGEGPVPQAEVDACLERERGGVLEPAADRSGETVDRPAVGHDDPLPAPRLAQRAGEQCAAARAGHAVEVVVGGHEPGDPGARRRVRRSQMDLAQLARADRGAGTVAPADARTLPGQMLGDHGHVLRIDPLPGGGALHALHGRLDQHRRDRRVLAETLLGTAPARIAQHVQPGDQQEVGTALPGLGGDGLAELPSEVRVHPGAEGEIHRERRAAQRHQPVRCLLDEQHRYSVAVPGHVLLHGGVRLGAALGRDSAAPAHRRPRIRAQHPVQRTDPAEPVHLRPQLVGDLWRAIHPAHGLPALQALVDLADQRGAGEVGQWRPFRGRRMPGALGHAHDPRMGRGWASLRHTDATTDRGDQA